MRKRIARQRVGRYTFTVVYEPAEEGGYNVVVPALLGCNTFGKNLEHAQEMARDAIQLYCQSLLDDGEPIPQEVDGRGEFIGTVSVTIPGNGNRKQRKR